MAKSKSTSSATSTSRDENAVVKYVKETRAELRKVTWPTGEETRNLTTIIVIVTVAMALFLGLLDFIFQRVATGLIATQFIWVVAAVVLFAAGAAAFYVNGQQE